MQKLLIIFFTLSINYLYAQDQEPEYTYACKNANGTTEYLYIKGYDLCTPSQIQYGSSKNGKRINLKIFSSSNCINEVKFPTSPAEYVLTQINSNTITCKNPNGVNQVFEIEVQEISDYPTVYMSNNVVNNIKEYLWFNQGYPVGANTLEYIYYSSYKNGEIKTKPIKLTIVKQNEDGTITVKFPNDAKLYKLDIKIDMMEGTDHLICTNPDGSKQIFQDW